MTTDNGAPVRVTDLRELAGEQIERPEPMTFPDGVQYDMKLPHEFSMPEKARLNQLTTLMKQDSGDPVADAESQKGALLETVEMAYPEVPDDVLDGLSELQLVHTAADFLEILLLAPEETIPDQTQATMARIENLMAARQSRAGSTPSRASKSDTKPRTR